MDVREERRRWCVEQALKIYKSGGAAEVVADAKVFEAHLAELDETSGAPAPAARPAPRIKGS